MIEVESASKAEARDRKQRTIIQVLFVVGFLGLAYAAYDYMTLVNRVALSPSLSAVDPVIEQWKASGLVHSFDAMRATLVVNEGEWETKNRPEKIGIITQLARYCADKNNSQSWGLTVKGRSTSATLGEMGPKGILVN